MKKTNLYYAIAATLAVAAAPTTATAAITGLNFTSGVGSCVLGGTFPACSYSLTDVASGSFFSMDADGNGTVATTEKVAMTSLATIDFTNTTAALGSHTGVINGSETPVFDIWEFFGSTGMTQLTSAIVDNGDGTLDFSGWDVSWNGIASIPMGGDPANNPADTGLATISFGACNDGDAFTLTYDAHVPLNDPSNFGGVAYSLSLEGTVSAVPVPAAVWLFGSGLLGLVGVARRKKQA